MKKIIILAISLFISLNMILISSFAAESNLIKNMKISLKSNESPRRLEVSFDLTESINLSQGDSNIIFEYFAKDNGGNLEIIQYKKDRSWSGYLNSYDNYPLDEHKYSSGAQNAYYSDNVPATTIYTSTKTSASIDVDLVAAVKVTVLRANGSGEKVTISDNGTISDIEKIEVPIVEEDKSTGIRLESTTAELPTNTTLVASKLTSGTIYKQVSTIFTNAKDFIVFEIKLEADEKEILPDGKVKISIPIPENFNISRLEVYRINNNNGTRISYPITVTTKEGVKCATFETEHFSTYVLAEITEKELEEVDKTDETDEIDENKKAGGSKDLEGLKTGETELVYYIITLAVISLIGIVVLQKKTRQTSR